MTYHPIVADVGGWLFPCVVLGLCVVLLFAQVVIAVLRWCIRRKEARLQREAKRALPAVEHVHATPPEYFDPTERQELDALTVQAGMVVAYRKDGRRADAEWLYGELCERYGQTAVDAAIARAEGKE